MLTCSGYTTIDSAKNVVIVKIEDFRLYFIDNGEEKNWKCGDTLSTNNYVVDDYVENYFQ